MSALGLRFYTHEGDRDALRDQFALHAPPVPDWFEACVEPAPEFSSESCNSGANGDHFYDACDNHKRYRDAVERWRKRRDIAKTIQWPYHYADLVLAERDVVQARRENRE